MSLSLNPRVVSSSATNGTQTKRMPSRDLSMAQVLRKLEVHLGLRRLLESTSTPLERSGFQGNSEVHRRARASWQALRKRFERTELVHVSLGDLLLRGVLLRSVRQWFLRVNCEAHLADRMSTSLPSHPKLNPRNIVMQLLELPAAWLRRLWGVG